MFYEEKIIDGVMWYRTSPKGRFKPVSKARLNEIIIELNDKIEHVIMQHQYLLEDS